mmetsp:Transcript_12946/g.32868  ORF Transcript_12946/g.32868 Transcript_12946/m.32868 type:complete len:401 (+) Transcript_12946:138-1340(+)
MTMHGGHVPSSHRQSLQFSLPSPRHTASPRDPRRLANESSARASRLLVGLAQQADGGEDPHPRRPVGAQRRRERERRPADGRRVDGALVDALGDELRARDALDEHDGQRRVELLGEGVGEAVGLLVPPRTLDEEAVHVRALLGLARHRLVLVLRHLGVHCHRVERQALGASGHLHARGHVAHWVEEARDPDGLRQHERLVGPQLELLDAQQQVEEPGREVLAVVRAGGAHLAAQLEPQVGHAVERQVTDERVHHVGDIKRAGEPERQLRQGARHLGEDAVHPLELLQAADNVRRDGADLGLDVEHHELLGQPVLDVCHRVAGDLLLGLADAADAAAAATREDDDLVEEVGRLRLQQRDLRVRVEAEEDRRLGGQRVLDVLFVVVEGAVAQGLVAGGEHVV